MMVVVRQPEDYSFMRHLISNKLFFLPILTQQSKVRELVSVQSAKEHDMDYNSTIRRMKKFLPSVKVLRSQFESKSAVQESQTKTAGTAKSVEASDPSSVRKWKSTSNFHPDSSSEAERSRSRSSSMGSLDELTSSLSATSSTSGGATSSSSAPVTEKINKKIEPSASIISLVQPIIPPGTVDQEKNYDMYQPRHSTAQWNPV